MLDGGSLDVEFLDDERLLMIGNVATVFDGVLDKAMFESKSWAC